MSARRIGTRDSIGIAVRDGADLLLILDVCRSLKGDVYVNFHRDNDPNWKPHTSYHASGQHHQKSHGRKSLVRQRQKPKQGFIRSENVLTAGIAADEPRAIGNICRASDFAAIFEIPIRDLGREKYRTFISVDITQPGGQPVTTPGSKIVRNAVFQGATPWIHVTLFDTGSQNK